MAKWGQTPGDLRLAAGHAPRHRTRERFRALYRIASGPFNAATRAAHTGRRDDAVLGWAHRHNAGGPGALTYRRTGGHAPPPKEVERIVGGVEETRPTEHGPPGHGWTPRTLRRWGFPTVARHPSRSTTRRVVRRAKRTWKKVK